jgi:hypothetical protein
MLLDRTSAMLLGQRSMLSRDSRLNFIAELPIFHEMQERDGFTSAFRREPSQAWRMLRVAMGGAVAIVLWDWVGGLFLPEIVVLGVLLAGVLLYGSLLAYLIGRLVRSMDRWQIETARQASRLANSMRESGAGLKPPAPQAGLLSGILPRSSRSGRQEREAPWSQPQRHRT